MLILKLNPFHFNNQQEEDEFDAMTKSKKTLKEKLGTPEEVEKKVKKKKGGDGLKQSKLNFEKKGAKIVIIDIWTVLMFLLPFF